MIKLNNKGQSLVLFVLLLPIMLFVMMLVYDMGVIYCDKKELDNVNYLVVSYGVKHASDADILTDLVEMINLNCDDVSNISVNIKDDVLYVDLEKDSRSIMGNMFNISLYEIESSYVGYIGDNKIERIK